MEEVSLPDLHQVTLCFLGAPPGGRPHLLPQVKLALDVVNWFNIVDLVEVDAIGASAIGDQLSLR